jgi:hypothetical protein
MAFGRGHINFKLDSLKTIQAKFGFNSLGGFRRDFRNMDPR